MNKYRSKFESRVGSTLKEKWKYEDRRFLYNWERVYIPDFSRESLHFEVKGRFRPGDSSRYKFILKSIKERGELLVFVIQDNICTACKQIIKWCGKHEVAWITEKDITLYKNCKDKNDFEKIYKTFSDSRCTSKTKYTTKSSRVDRKVHSRKTTRGNNSVR